MDLIVPHPFDLLLLSITLVLIPDLLLCLLGTDWEMLDEFGRSLRYSDAVSTS